MKKFLIIIILPVCILLINYSLVTIPSNSVISGDGRNDGVNIWVHYEYFINPGTLVFDLRSVRGDKSTVDVFRVLFQVAEKLQEKRFDKVILSSKGNRKFYIEGSYFKEIGSSFSYQNPMYLLRTFPENTFLMNGTKAYSTWTGGFIGVMGEQMKDLNELAKDWFLADG
jgi:hypothetical protein